MNFDVRSYCERLAKADPRFKLREGGTWVLRDALASTVHDEVCWCDEAGELWAFIGPLADELRVLGDDITSQEKQPDGRYLSGFLEATFAAVCKKMEANR